MADLGIGGSFSKNNGPYDCFYAKVMLCGHFDEECRRIVEEHFGRTVELNKGEHFHRAGDDAYRMYLLCEGWAARYVILQDGQRQITEILMPGDLFPVHAAMVSRSTGDGVVALNACRAAIGHPTNMERAALQNANLARSLWWLSQRDKEILKAWIANNGHRQAEARVAHLLCELSTRASHVGLMKDGTFEFPLTQQDLADITGLTTVHISRTLKKLREQGLLELKRNSAHIPSLARLQEAACFNAAYLEAV